MNNATTPSRSTPSYTLGEEIANSITHGLGAALSIAGCVLLIVFSAFSGDAYKVVSAAIYGTSLIILFTMSTIYHAITNKTAKFVLRVFDHSSIFILIAGTYTPLTLVTLRGALGWTIFGAVPQLGLFSTQSVWSGLNGFRWRAMFSADGALCSPLYQWFAPWSCQVCCFYFSADFSTLWEFSFTS